LGLGVFVVGVSLFSISIFQNKRRESRRLAILSHYHDVVQVIEDTELYQQNGDDFFKVGKLYQKAILELEKISGEYFQIKGTDYYVKYDKVEEGEKVVDLENHYLLFNQDAVVLENSPLSVLGQKQVELPKKIRLSVLEKGDIYKLTNGEIILEVEKNSIETFIESENCHEETLEKLSIFYFETSDNIEEKLQLLKEDNYTFISEKELISFFHGNIVLPKHTTMLIFKEIDEKVTTLQELYHLTINEESQLTLTYQKGDEQVNRLDHLVKYVVDGNTSKLRFQEMLKGKKEEVIKNYATSIPVLNYHFFYDPNIEVCDESICLEKTKFEEQLNYLKENGYKTLTMQEFYDWYQGKINLPKKSVLLTVDDGAAGTFSYLPDLLEKYDLRATLFLISGWWPMSRYRVGHLEIQSHGHDLHHNNFSYQGKTGVKGLLLPKEELLQDLRLSKSTIGNPIAFCYPFYAYNERLVSAVKEEFKLAFVGGNKKATRNGDIYHIPRYVIYNTTSLGQFQNMIK